ncbi:hypothetical protein H0H87_011033 [Tephrocybe sp. NHM501043]|nr:hypothetical protein H0H87_011033 [Tephrocybe sp. NHM501043]
MPMYGSLISIFAQSVGTHYPIALYAIERGIHVLVTKPATQLLSHHNDLIAAAKKHNVVCFVEHHKRDAKARAKSLGEFNYFNAWMSQPKSQLETFRAWAGKDSDIRQVILRFLLPLNKPDFAATATICPHTTSISAAGFCKTLPFRPELSPALPRELPQTEDTITLLVDWQSVKSPKHKGTAVYTASWTAPLKAGVHSAQHWYYMGEKSGHFDGQRGYGYISIEKFIDAARSVNAGLTKPADYDTHGLPTIANTVLTTAILNAGRISLDEKRAVGIKKDGETWVLE